MFVFAYIERSSGYCTNIFVFPIVVIFSRCVCVSHDCSSTYDISHIYLLPNESS